MPPRSCSLARSRPGEGPRSGQGFCSAGRPSSPARSRVDATGISQVFRRSIPCLCSGPGPRSSRRALAIAVTSVLPPLGGRRRPRTTCDFGANPQLRHLLPYASRARCRTRARLASGWPARPLSGRESNPLDRCERFQLVLTIIPLSCSPDATTLRRWRWIFDADDVAPRTTSS